LKFQSDGVDSEGKTIQGEVSVNIFDSDGQLVNTINQSYSGNEQVEFPINLDKGQYFTVENSNPKSDAKYGVFTVGKKGTERRDNMHLKGEDPKTEDGEAAAKIILKRGKR